jgi:hypothetical protein
MELGLNSASNSKSTETCVLFIKIYNSSTCTLTRNNYQTPWHKVCLEKLVIAQLIKKLHTFLTPESLLPHLQKLDMVPTLSQVNQVHTLICSFLWDTFYFNIPRYPELYVSCCLTVILFALLISPLSVFCLGQLINLHLIILTKNNSHSTVC